MDDPLTNNSIEPKVELSKLHCVEKMNIRSDQPSSPMATTESTCLQCCCFGLKITVQKEMETLKREKKKTNKKIFINWSYDNRHNELLGVPFKICVCDVTVAWRCGSVDVETTWIYIYIQFKWVPCVFHFVFFQPMAWPTRWEKLARDLCSCLSVERVFVPHLRSSCFVRFFCSVVDFRIPFYTAHQFAPTPGRMAIKVLARLQHPTSLILDMTGDSRSVLTTDPLRKTLLCIHLIFRWSKRECFDKETNHFQHFEEFCRILMCIR